jgi:hypothetical protein
MTEGTHALRAEYTPMGKKISGDGHEYSRKWYIQDDNMNSFH